MAKKYSIEIANAIRTHLDNDDWNYSFNEEKGIFEFKLRMSSCRIKEIRYRIEVREDFYLVYILSPIGADKDDADMMCRMGEFLHRATYGIINGNFELDYRDGEIRYKSFVDCEDQIPSDGIICNSIHMAAGTFKHYADGIVSIIFSNISAEDANKSSDETHLKRIIQHLTEPTDNPDTEDADEETEQISEQLLHALFDDEEDTA